MPPTNQAVAKEVSASSTRRRDVRIDRIGFVDELRKQWIESDGGIKDKVKAAMSTGETVEGDYFVGRLDASTVKTIDPAAVLRLYHRGKLTQSEFLSMIKIIAEPAAKLIEPKLLGRISESAPGAPRLVVSRKPGVVMGLVQAVKGINDALDNGQL